VSFIDDMEVGSKASLSSALNGFNDGLLLIDDICILSKEAATVLADELRKLKDQPIVVIATSRLPTFSLPISFQHFFPISLSINSLSIEHRKDIIRSYHRDNVELIAKQTAGLTRGELATVCRLLKDDVSNLSEVLRCVSIPDRPLQLPSVHEEFAGYQAILDELRLFFRVLFTENGDRVSLLGYNGILLHGSSGNGKSSLIRKLHEEFEVPFFVLEIDKIFSKFLGDSEKSIREIFNSARFFAPCVLVIENIDAIGSKRNDESGVGGRVLSTLLNEIDGISETRKVLTIGTTNAIELVDSALLRPGRFDRLIEIGFPPMRDRVAIIEMLRRSTPVSEDVTSESLAGMSEGFSCADVISFFRYSALQALFADEPVVTLKYFEIGIERLRERRAALAPILQKKRGMSGGIFG